MPFAEVVPAISSKVFRDGIQHPDLYLWDAWSARDGATLHLYCLAVSATCLNGETFPPEMRNHARFHIRHFTSVDSGQSWHDQGCYQRSRPEHQGFDARTIWSGSILPLQDGRQLTAYTGIRDQGEELMFQQSLALSISHDWNSVVDDSYQVISDPVMEREAILAAGYFLDSPVSLGHKDGEDGGPIMAWRDPFLLEHAGELHMFWGAKLNGVEPALGHAILTETESGFEISKLFPALSMPDGNEYTQLELPKVYFDDKQNRFLMLVSSCNRLHERQSDAEADKRMRLYQADSLAGPWYPFGHQGSCLQLAEPNMFGVTILDADFERQVFEYVAPYTQEAGSDKFLTLSKTYTLDISALGD
jgi:hypothetical protein